MNPELITKIINSAGLLFDIAGACFVAWEVVYRFEGTQLKRVPLMLDDTIAPPDKTPEFEQYEHDKYIKMKFGLGLLIIGFLLQMASNWTCYFF